MAQREYQRWLQVQYPVDLAKRCIIWNEELRKNKAEYQRFKDMIQTWIQEKRFQLWQTYHELWIPDHEFTTRWAQVSENEEMGGQSRGTWQWVRMAANFADVLQSTDRRPAAQQAHRSPTESLLYLMSRIFPYSWDIFEHTSPMGVKKFLSRNHYVMEQAFVAMILSLSRRLPRDSFPCGVWEWPPPGPKKARSQNPGGAAASSGLSR